MHLVSKWRNQNTFEAGYTAWDQRLQRLFLELLCIPTVLFLTPGFRLQNTFIESVTGNG
jgi:hypothetical protein